MENNHLSNIFSGGYYGISKSLIRVFGIEKALWLAVLYDWRGMLIKQDKLTEDDFFYLTQDTIFDETGISTDKQTKFILYFEDLGIISKERRGIPSKNFYKINSFRMVEYVNDQFQKITGSSNRKQRELESANSGVNNNNIERISSNTFTSKEVKDAGAGAGIVHQDKPKIRITRETKPVYSALLSLKGYTPESKQLMIFWNSLSYPIKHHQLDPDHINSKIVTRSLEALDRKLNMGFTPDYIKQVMTKYERLISLGGFKHPIVSCSVALDQFLEPNKFASGMLRKLGIRSWFDECCAEWDALEERHSRQVKDKYPAITEELIATWPGERRKFTINEINILRRTSERLYNYSMSLKDFKDDNEASRDRPASFAHFIWRLLQDRKKINGVVPGWINSEMFFLEFNEYLKEIKWIVPGWDGHSSRVEEDRLNRMRNAERERRRIDEEAQRTAFSQTDFL
jgi:hypothetical protein